MSPRHPPTQKGFTLIEMMVTVVIISVLATMVMPLTKLAVQRNKETELRTNLRQIRTAINAYKTAWDEGYIARRIGETGYPPSLQVLVEGIANIKDPMGNKIRFLRRLPSDPFADGNVPVEQTWGKRSYASEADHPQEGADVYDVYSLNPGTGLNHRPYRLW